ncbi:MAG: hypothetical protein ACTSUT_01860 [Promethearchaeota archaeon]
METFAIINFIDNWQTLVGSAIGIILPIAFWYYKRYCDKKEKHKEILDYLEKYLVNATNSIYDTRFTIEKFLNNQFKGLKENVKMRNDSCYSTDYAFFPFIGMDFIDYKILSINTKSGYLDNKMALVLRNLKDLTASIDDSRRQFTHTVDMNNEMASKKLNAPSVQNSMYKKNLEEFEKMIREIILGKNIKTAIYTLTSSRIVLLELRKIGVKKWKRKFAGTSFRYFKGKKELNKFKKSVPDRIDEYFKEKIDKEIKKLEKGYKEW